MAAPATLKRTEGGDAYTLTPALREVIARTASMSDPDASRAEPSSSSWLRKPIPRYCLSRATRRRSRKTRPDAVDNEMSLGNIY